MAVQKTMQLLAAKLDLGENEKVVSKAAELERLLLNKTVAGSSITDTAKAVICLDLASSLCGVDVNVKMAIKYSGLKAPSYLNNRKMVENLLELNTERLTVPALCLTLQCSGVQAAAEDILREYQAKSKMELDLDLPQYVCMAVYQACRLNKVKVLKSKVIEKSRIKPGQWTKMDSDWTKFVDEHFASVAKKKRGRPPKNVTVEDAPNEEQMDVACNENKDGPQLIEPYNDWKQRILEIAYKELEELSRLESKTESLHSPRRSPRKTPQKFSPYKNCPNTSKGVNSSLLTVELKEKFVQLGPDEETKEFLSASIDKSSWVWTQIWYLLAKAVLRRFWSVTDINGWLGRGSMFVLSSAQATRLLPSAPSGPLVDVGAGDGEVSRRFAHLYEEKYATEISACMRKVLVGKGYTILDTSTWWQSHRFGCVAMLNLLDRCSEPRAMLRQARAALDPAGVLLLALVLPYKPYVEVTPNHKPNELLPIEGSTFEEQVVSFVQFMETLGFELSSWTRAPYLCEGDFAQAYYWLDDSVYVFRTKPIPSDT